MKKAKKATAEELRYLAFMEIYTRFQEPKTCRRAHGLLEAAVACVAKRGFVSVTMEGIAREAGVTRPLVRHYFKDLDEIRDFTAKYVRLVFQRIAIEHMMNGVGCEAMLSNYLDACFHWVDHFKVHSRFWLSFLQLCSTTTRPRGLNTKAAQAGERRIESLLELGVAEGKFRLDDTYSTAKIIQSVITGALVVYTTENLTDPLKFREGVKATIFQMVSCSPA